MFLHGTIEDKRFITQTVLSNATYYDGKLYVELHPVFDTLFRLSKEHELKNQLSNRLKVLILLTKNTS